MTNSKLQLFLDGKKLYGDDFSLEEIEKWFNDEKEGYSGLVDNADYEYPYLEFDKRYFWKFLPKELKELNALGIGSAFGKEFISISPKLKYINIVEPSDYFVQTEIDGVPCTYTKPRIDGKLDFTDNSFDIITCFSCLHHIPNVSTVFRELVRVLKPGGYIFLREPITTMRGTIRDFADFQKPVPGLTKRERGIPLQYFYTVVKDSNLNIVKVALHSMHIDKILGLVGCKNMYNSKICLKVDAFLSNIFQYNYQYHASSLIRKIRPAGVAFVLQKGE